MRVVSLRSRRAFIFFFFNDTATTEIYTLSLHDALPISELNGFERYAWVTTAYLLASTSIIPVIGKLGDVYGRKWFIVSGIDRKSTRLNSSHANISYAVFCLKKKKQNYYRTHSPVINIIK